jgi:hypothetical protein
MLADQVTKAPKGASLGIAFRESRIELLGNCHCTPGRGGRVCTYRTLPDFDKASRKLFFGMCDVVETPGRASQICEKSCHAYASGDFSGTCR